MKRLIATYGIGQLHYLRPAVESMRAYCSRVGADFWEIKFFPEAAVYGGSPAWLHIEALKRFRAQTYYDELLLLDADVLILPGCDDIFRHDGDLVAVPDIAWPIWDDRFIGWCRRNYGLDMAAHAGRPYFNAGVMLWRRKALEIVNLDGPYPTEWPIDQDFLNLRAFQHGLNVTFLGQEYNWREVSNTSEALTQKILHFVGHGKPLIHHYDEILRYHQEWVSKASPLTEEAPPQERPQPPQQEAWGHVMNQPGLPEPEPPHHRHVTQPPRDFPSEARVKEVPSIVFEMSYA